MPSTLWDYLEWSNTSRKPLTNWFHGSLPSLDPFISDSWLVFILSSVTLGIYTRKYPPGPSFTYAWLWLGIISYLAGSDDAKALFYITGFGLMCGWYGIQLFTEDIWDRILVYWLDIFPSWCVSTMVRTGDVLIHVIPFTLCMGYFNKVTVHHLIQAVFYERLYFLAIEGYVVGDGTVANQIYALRPPCSARVFRKLQMFSTVGYCFASSVCASTTTQQVFLQLLWLIGFIVVGLDSRGFLDDAAQKIATLDKSQLMAAMEVCSWDDFTDRVQECVFGTRKDGVTAKPEETPPPSESVLALLLPLASRSKTKMSALVIDNCDVKRLLSLLTDDKPLQSSAREVQAPTIDSLVMRLRRLGTIVDELDRTGAESAGVSDEGDGMSDSSAYDDTRDTPRPKTSHHSSMDENVREMNSASTASTECNEWSTGVDERSSSPWEKECRRLKTAAVHSRRGRYTETLGATQRCSFCS